MFYTQIREKYPNPVSALKPIGKRYCIGGAVCMFFGYQHDFPSPEILRDVLEYHFRLPPEMAYLFASKIIKRNDEAAFEVAWLLLATAESEGGWHDSPELGREV